MAKKYGSSAEKVLSLEEREYLVNNIHVHLDRVILIGTAYAGLRIEELVQCRKTWLRWEVLSFNDKKKRVLAIRVPIEDKNIVNKYCKNWKIKTHNYWLNRGIRYRDTYILDENLATEFMLFYYSNPEGISAKFKSKNSKSISQNISMYRIGVIFLKKLQEFHYSRGLELNQILELRTKLSAHPLRATYETFLFYEKNISIDIASQLLGHSEETAKKHYIKNSNQNIQNKLAKQILSQ
jgi:integrase